MVPQGKSPPTHCPSSVSVWVSCRQSAPSNSAPPDFFPLQVVAGKPRFPADPAAEKPSPQPLAWGPETGHLLSPRYTQKGTAIAEHPSPTGCGRTGPHLQVRVSRVGM